MTLSNDRIFMWVTRPERPKGAKDEVKRPEGPPARSHCSGSDGLDALLPFKKNQHRVTKPDEFLSVQRSPQSKNHRLNTM